MKVAVCAITYQRPLGLTRLLEGINQLAFEADPPDIRCIVVDNDESASARLVCDEIRSSFRWGLQYYIEPRRGIPFARNAAIAHAGTDYDYLAFIDDDEVPDPNWLDELLRVVEKYEGNVVAGPVVPHFEQEPPAWVIKGRFYHRPRHATGCQLASAATCNVLIRAEVLKTMESMFDERLALAGWDDTLFFRRVHGKGYKIVWADDAIVSEWMPATRVNAKWILRRAFRFGAGATYIERDLRSGFSAALLTIPTGLYRIGKGLFFFPLTFLFGQRFRVMYIRHICYGAGMLAGWLNVTYEEYAQTHGS